METFWGHDFIKKILTHRLPMNCLLYARVSTDKQAQKELSIPAQIDAMKQYAKRNGWKIIGHFIDEGKSAKTTNRPELRRLIRQCKENKNIDVVLVHKIDRLARNLIDYATVKAILKQKGIRMVSVPESFDRVWTTRSPLFRPFAFHIFPC